MPDIAIHLSADEWLRLQLAAHAQGMTAEQLAADELRRRYALAARGARVLPLRKPPTTGRHDD